MRIAVIAPPWVPVPPTAYGGTEMVIDTLARGLRGAGHEVLLATTGDSTCPVERTWFHDHARTDEIGDMAIGLTHLLHAYDAAASADIVHDHTVAGPVIGSLRSTRPIVTTNHGLFTDDMRALYRSLGDRVSIVAISHHHASTAGDVPIARVIHHGLDEDRYPVGPGGDHLVFVGRMSPTKGVRQAIEIAERAGRPLVLAAKMRSTDEHDYFDTEIKPLLGGDIHFAGEVGTADKLELLGGALALVNPIRWDEPFGLCMVEALACGTPVIAAPRGAAPEIVDHGVTGFLCTGTEEAAAATTWAGALDRRACRAAVTARFSAHRMVADHVALYHDVLARRVRPAA
jgi:glycosyltransferase involved in cell wall biosynthesis